MIKALAPAIAMKIVSGSHTQRLRPEAGTHSIRLPGPLQSDLVAGSNPQKDGKVFPGWYKSDMYVYIYTYIFNLYVFLNLYFFIYLLIYLFTYFFCSLLF